MNRPGGQKSVLATGQRRTRVLLEGPRVSWREWWGRLGTKVEARDLVVG
jgi:hypothetical protein